jgi:SAM-dependent methyltransferase
MDDRHVTNMERLVAGGGLEPAADVAGRACCVVGCWCGEENLLLHALGAAVADGVEEVPEYARAARMQLAAFGVPGQVRGLSLYEPAVLRACAGAYDLLYVPGVLYHLTDPVAALVVLWAMLRPGGLLAVETIVADRPGRVALYRGARDAGWNWWAPTADCWLAMMGDCGFAGCRRVDAVPGRGWFVGRRGASLPAWETGAAGFSRPDLLAEVGELCGLAAPVRASSGAGDMEGPGGSGGP